MNRILRRLHIEYYYHLSTEYNSIKYSDFIRINSSHLIFPGKFINTRLFWTESYSDIK